MGRRVGGWTRMGCGGDMGRRVGGGGRMGEEQGERHGGYCILYLIMNIDFFINNINLF